MITIIIGKSSNLSNKLKNINVNLTNVLRDEIEASIADTQLLLKIRNKKSFIKVEDYFIEEFNV